MASPTFVAVFFALVAVSAVHAAALAEKTAERQDSEGPTRTTHIYEGKQYFSRAYFAANSIRYGHR